ELAEEIGKRAERWREIEPFHTSPGFSDERVWLYLATELSDELVESEENERIEIVAWGLERLDQAIAECEDSKSLIALLWLALALAHGELASDRGEHRRKPRPSAGHHPAPAN